MTPDEEAEYLRMRADFLPVVQRAVLRVHRATFGVVDAEDLHAEADLVLFERRAQFWEAWKSEDYERLVFTSVRRALSDYVNREVQARFPDFEAYTPNTIERMLEAYYNGSSGSAWGSHRKSSDSEFGDFLASQADLTRGLKVCTPEMRATLALIYGNPGVPMSELAEELGVPEGTLRSQKHRALRRLTSALSHPYGIQGAMAMEVQANSSEDEAG